MPAKSTIPNSARRTSYGTGYSNPGVDSAGPYPLQGRFFILGIAAGCIGAILFRDIVAGYALFTLFFNAGLVWGREEPPSLAYALSYQWFYAAAGFLFYIATGVVPGKEMGTSENFHLAVALSMAGITCVALGMRFGSSLLEAIVPHPKVRLAAIPSTYNVSRLFLLAVAASLIDLVWRVSPVEVSQSGSQILYRLFDIRIVAIVLLWTSVLRQRKGYSYAVVIGVTMFVAGMGSPSAKFLLPFMLFFVCLLGEWRPWSPKPAARARNRQVVSMALIMVAIVVVLGGIWEGGVKNAWRSQILNQEGEVVGEATRGNFLRAVRQEAPGIGLREAFEGSAARTSSGALYFSLVLDRIPALIPFEHGRLILRAVNNILKPRIFFPDKQDLGSDSWLVVQYAGLDAAGDEKGASIGLGYLAEFYIDFGAPLMFLPALVLGFLIGIGFHALRLVSPSLPMWFSVGMVLCSGALSHYEAEIGKVFGGLIMSMAVYGVLLAVFGRFVHRWLLEPHPPADS